MPLTNTQLNTIELIRATATSLWDVSESCWQAGVVYADDWEAARCAASHLLAALAQPPAPTSGDPWIVRSK